MKYIKLASPFIGLWLFSYLLHITPKDADWIAVPLIFTGVYTIFYLICLALKTSIEEFK